MLSPLASVGVATLCFYIPTLVAFCFLCYRQRKAPAPTAWFLMVFVCLIRIAGAVLSLLYPSNNVGVEAATFALLSAGGLPLLLSMTLLLNNIKIIDFHGVKASHYGIVVLRLLFLATLVLTIAGVRMLVQMDNPAVMRIGKGLAEAGSVMALVLLTVCVGGELFVWIRHGNTISSCSKRILTGNLTASLFLLIRLVYFCLAMFDAGSANSTWSPLTGSVAALVCMALLPEFFVLMVYAWVGFTIDYSSHGEQRACSRVQQGSIKLDGDGDLV
ncbi:hypothetical protein Q7P37_000800 [Cladosporium fusiforme]